MWLGELLTEKGIGNGMSVLIFTSIAARIPAEGGAILQSRGGFVFSLICVLAVLVILSFVLVEPGPGPISVLYPKRIVGQRMDGGEVRSPPLRAEQAGLM